MLEHFENKNKLFFQIDTYSNPYDPIQGQFVSHRGYAQIKVYFSALSCCFNLSSLLGHVLILLWFLCFVFIFFRLLRYVVFVVRVSVFYVLLVMF
jgi:hypothetical protein